MKQYLMTSVEIECSSKLAYRRVGRLCCFAIQRALDNEDQHLSTLVQALVRLVNLSMDPRLVNGCPRSPKLHFETDSLGGIALSFHNSPLDYSAPLLDYIVAHWPTEALVLIEDVCRVSESLNESMFPALLLKVKAHPDKALASLGSLLPMVASKATMTDEWASVLVKHLMGTDEARAQLAQSVLVRWLPHQPIGLRALADAKPPLAPARVRLYQVLEPVASEIKEDSIDAVVLDAIIGWLTKDTKKQAGWQALVVWLRRGSLHAPALEAIRKAVQSTEGGEMLELLVRNPLDASTLAALFENDAFGQSLEKFVSNQSKKKSNYDGLLAICVQLLHAHNNEVKVAPWTARVTESSFYSFPVNDIVCSTYPRLVALYCQLQGSSWLDKTFVLDCICSCIMFPYGEDCAVKSLLENLSSVVESRPTVADSLIRRLLQNVNEEALSVKEQARKRQKLEAGTDGPLTRCKEYSIRMAARLLAPHATASDVFTVAAVLMHYGTTVSSGVRHRKKLCDALLWVVRQQLSSSSQLQFSVDIVADLACSTSVSYQDGSEHPSSEGVRGATLSLITSMGRASSTISEGFEDLSDVDSRPHQLLGDFLVTSLSTKLVVILETVLKQIETVSEDDIALYRSPRGTLVASSNADRAEKPKNRSLNEDEAWEREIKEQLSRKKGSVGSVVTLSAQQKKELEEQDDRRDTVSLVVESAYPRVLASLSALVSSDIEVGNRCIPFLYSAMLRAAVMRCPVTESVHSVRQRSVSALVDLAGCVYEISEAHAPAIAESLLLCTTFSSRETDGLDIATLPSPCAPVATVVAQIENVGDTLSSNSFLLLLPILRSCLMGPRSIVGCDSVLKVIEQHIPLLSDPESSVGANERKALVGALLELLSHDRSQTFRSPSPIDILVALFSVDEDVVCLGPSDISPLLDSRGALGPLSCRKASMVALRAVVVSCRKVLRSNPLVESRVWICCFAEDDELRQEGRTTWFLMHDIEDAEEGQELPSPSPLFGPLLVPLLSNQDDAIAKAAAFAFANALGRHPGSSEKSIENLCKTYISACPVLDDGTSGSDATEDIAPRLPPPKKPALATGLPKKKKVSGKVSALSVMSKPKATKKKANTAVMAAMLKPKQERSLGADDLASQFVGKKKTVALEEDSKDKVDVRLGVLRALQALCSPGTYAMQPATLQKVTAFLVAFGIADADSAVKALSTDTLRDSIAVHGSSEEAIAFLLPFLEEVLKSGSVDLSTLENLSIDKVPGGVAPMDRRKEGAVVALGSVALHLKGPDNEAKIDASVEMLLSALGTPSEDVQSSVADALSKLMKKGRTPQRAEEILASLLQGCLRGATLASRRGSAYGLAAAVKGTGIAALKKFDIVKSLEEACSSGDAVEKEGSLFAIELLSKRLGLLFEPYVIVLLPSLLRCFADSSDHVRSAASATSEVIMAKLSAHGVKLVLPAVLTSFNDSAWRTKQASIKLLGAMSHLAPKQLASALPKVVPKLIEAFGDTQQKVKASAQDALDEISTVIKNPEVSSISALLLKALTDPAENTVKALEGLIATEFLHAIDAPSLALIVPIVHRGLRERGASTKRYSGLIAGNICTMINDPRDFVPYLPILLPDLQTALVDPIPDVRSTSAKALGSLTRSLGDQILPELRPWLIRKLRDESCSSAERSGAAQGLTEVLIASGTSSIDETMTTEILPLGMYPEAATREGVLWMMCFLPSAMGQAYTGLIDPSLPVLLSGLSDDSESVRDVAMRAGRTLIRSHGKVHVDKILPSLEVGLANGDHRIRVASLSLLGDLLSTIGGTQMMKGDGNTQDDIRRAERAQAQIALVLGTETRKRVLSRLYLARSDTMHAVRSGAIQVWKTVVSVTARTLRDVLPVLVAQVVTGLASGSEDTTEMAGRCLGDIVSKLGDSVLPQVVPVLRKTLDDGDQHSKRGVCVGLTEVLKASTKDQIVKYLDIIVRVVQDAISDEDVDVRRMAAASFQSLYGVVGSVALDEIVPSLMVSMENTTDAVTRERAMNGLAGILSVRSRELLPYIIPRLIQTPLTLDHVVALSRVASVTGESLYHHFRSIIPILIDEMSRVRGTDLSEKESALDECVRSICKSADSTGVYIFIGEVASKCGSDKAFVRRESCTMLNVIVTERKYSTVMGRIRGCCV